MTSLFGVGVNTAGSTISATGNLLKKYNNYAMQQAQNAQTHRELNQALQNAQMEQEKAQQQAPLIPRQAAEGYNARNVGLSTMADTGMQRAQSSASRWLQGASTNVNVRSNALDTFGQIRQLQTQNLGADAAIGIGNALTGGPQDTAGFQPNSEFSGGGSQLTGGDTAGSGASLGGDTGSQGLA